MGCKMAIFDVFSKRRKRELGEVIDVYEYLKIPNGFKIQIYHAINPIYKNRRDYDYETNEFVQNELSDVFKKIL